MKAERMRLFIVLEEILQKILKLQKSKRVKSVIWDMALLKKYEQLK